MYVRYIVLHILGSVPLFATLPSAPRLDLLPKL